MELSRQIRGTMDTLSTFLAFATSDEILHVDRSPEACDFLFGNPHDVAGDAYVSAVQGGAVPTGPKHYAYVMSERVATEPIAAGLRERFDLPFTAEDIVMTNGNFTGLAVMLRVLADPGDEVVFVSPPWFFYETLIVSVGAVPVRVFADPTTFDLDLKAIAEAIGPKTRAIIVNSPNNPSGRIYARESLDRLGDILTEASERHGRPIHLLSDEAYNRILFDHREFPTPLGSYVDSTMLYTYGKTHLAPGNRLGYLALNPAMEDRGDLLVPLMTAIITGGWGFPVASLQHAVPALDRQGAAIERLQRRRDQLVPALRDQGYDVIEPEGTFYVLVRSPEPDDLAFCARLRTHGVYVLPGATFEMPGWFRISVTASDDMVDRSIPGFAKAFGEVSP